MDCDCVNSRERAREIRELYLQIHEISLSGQTQKPTTPTYYADPLSLSLSLPVRIDCGLYFLTIRGKRKEGRIQKLTLCGGRIEARTIAPTGMSDPFSLLNQNDNNLAFLARR